MERTLAGEINGMEGSKAEHELDAVDPETVAELDDAPATVDDGPSPAEFEGFVSDVDTDAVSSDTTEDVPIDASMDELFAE